MGLFAKIKFDTNADRLGPDLPFTHWRLFFKSTMRSLCIKKFNSFGDNSEVRPFSYIVNCSKISIGRNVIIRPNSFLFADNRDPELGKIIINDDVLIGSGVHIYVSNHKYGVKGKTIYEQGHFAAENTILEKGCWLGANTILLPGITIGENSIVGAGSVVTKSIPSNTIYAGNPAKYLKSIVDKHENLN